jgi:hypothetical protein
LNISRDCNRKAYIYKQLFHNRSSKQTETKKKAHYKRKRPTFLNPTMDGGPDPKRISKEEQDKLRTQRKDDRDVKKTSSFLKGERKVEVHKSSNELTKFVMFPSNPVDATKEQLERMFHVRRSNIQWLKEQGMDIKTEDYWHDYDDQDLLKKARAKFPEWFMEDGYCPASPSYFKDYV